MNLGNKIAQLRKDKNITQEALAQQLGLTNQAVSKWESGQCCPDVTLLPKLADIFGVSIDALFDREPKAAPVQTEDLPWPDDEILRVAVYVGRSLKAGGLPNGEYRVELDVAAVLSCVSVGCGDVAGNVDAEGSVTCGNVSGNVSAGEVVNCATVEGNVDAGENVNCGDVLGHVNARCDVNCGNVEGNVTAGCDVSCDNVAGSVRAGCDVDCGTVGGAVSAGCDVTIQK